MSYVKQTSIPVEWHIEKFITYEFQTSGVVRFANKILYPVNDKAYHYRMYFCRKMPTRIDVEVYNPSLKAQFYLVRYIEQMFKYKLHTFIEAQVLAGRPAKHAAQYFLYTMLDLQESQYKIDRAYKSWQRYKKRTLNHKDVYLLSRA